MKQNSKKARFFLTIVGTAIVCFHSSVSNAQSSVADCQALFSRSFIEADLELISEHLKHRARRVCSAKMYEYSKYMAIGIAAETAVRMIDSDELKAAKRLLDGEGAANYVLNNHWKLNAARGDLHAKSGSWAKAYKQYSEAYEKLVDLKRDSSKKYLIPKRVNQYQADLYRKANEAQMLTGGLRASISRSGNASGTLGSRGPRPEPVPLPFQFEIDKARLLPQGEESVIRLVAMIAGRNYSEIEFVGHTDWTGSNNHNSQLSRRRARTVVDAVRRHWENHNVPMPRISFRAEGEDCPPRISDNTRYTKQQIAALYRRVEIIMPPAKIGETLDCGPKLYE